MLVSGVKKVCVSVLALGVVACGSREPEAGQESPTAPTSETAQEGESTAEAPTAEGAETATEPAETPAAPVDAALAALRARAEAIPFRWINHAPPDGFPSAFGAIGVDRRLVVPAEGETRTFEVDDTASLICRTGDTETWRIQLADPIGGLPVIGGYRAPDGEETILVAFPVERSWVVDARDASDGTQRWHASGGDGVVGAQLGIEGDLVAVHMRTADHDETFVLRVSDGLPVAQIPVHPEASRRERMEIPEGAITASASVPAPSRIACTGQSCTLQREGITGGLTFPTVVNGACRAFAVGGEGDEAIVAEICTNATGVTVHGGSLANGTLAYSTRPFGIGPIAHSRWSNEVRVAIEPRWIRLWGTESGLSYVTTLDRATGREISTITAR
jgi:hypothetical protein